MIDRERMTSFLDILIKEGVLKWVHNKKGSFLSTPKISSISSFNSFNKEEILEGKYQELAKAFSPELLEDFPTLNDFKVCYRLGLGEIPRCPICGARVAFRSQGSQYMKTCGKKECENAQVNISLTNSIKEKYGVENISQLDSIKKKKEETTLSHYGVRYLMQDPLYRKQKEDELFESCGVRNVSQLQEVKDKKRDTFQKNYGCDNYLISEEGSKKRKETLLLKYGVDNPSKSEIIKEKKKQTTLKNWGVENPFQAEGIKSKIKETCLKKYGTEYITQNPEVRKKCVETNKKNHGGILNLHLPEVMERAHSYKYLYDNQYFDSKEELAIYIYCLDFNIPIERNPLSLEYIANGDSHRYIVDLKIDGQLCEFKGGMLINDEGIWIPDPWCLNFLKNDPEALEREYIKYAEKQKCALNNGVNILTEKDVKIYIDYCISKFNNSKKWYLQFRQPKGFKSRKLFFKEKRD